MLLLPRTICLGIDHLEITLKRLVDTLDVIFYAKVSPCKSRCGLKKDTHKCVLIQRSLHFSETPPKKLVTFQWALTLLKIVWNTYPYMIYQILFSIQESIKGQLQCFHKLISNDRIWPSEHGFEVIFEKSLFVFEIPAFKVRNKRGIHSRFHSFSENNNRQTFVCDVTCDQSSVISTERSELRDCKASGNCYV